MRIRRAMLSAFMICGLPSIPAVAQEAVGMRLEAAGFTMRAANTPEKLSVLKSLPPRKFLKRTKAGARYFIYADPDYCQCAFVGDDRAMQAYRDMPTGLPSAPNAVPSGVSTESEIVQDMDDDLGGPMIDGGILDTQY